MKWKAITRLAVAALWTVALAACGSEAAGPPLVIDAAETDGVDAAASDAKSETLATDTGSEIPSDTALPHDTVAEVADQTSHDGVNPDLVPTDVVDGFGDLPAQDVADISGPEIWVDGSNHDFADSTLLQDMVPDGDFIDSADSGPSDLMTELSEVLGDIEADQGMSDQASTDTETDVDPFVDVQPDAEDLADSGADSFDESGEIGPDTVLTCEEACLLQEPLSGPVCLWSGVTLPDFCKARCEGVLTTCLTISGCPDVAYAGSCTSTCFIEPGAALVMGGTVPKLLCQDMNTQSPTHGLPYTDVFLKERVWIAYFGSCT